MSDISGVEGQDILEKFRIAVRNGQTRLALESLVDVIDVIVEIITPSEEYNEQPVQQPTKIEVVEEKPVSKKKQKDIKKDQPVTVAVAE